MTTTKYKNDLVDLFFTFKEQNVVVKFTEVASLQNILGTNLKDVSILDIGCGFGYHARWLAADGACVTGVDCSEDQIMKALELEQKDPRGINFLIADAAYLPKTNQYDVCLLVYMLQCANCENELMQYFKSAIDNLKPGGKVVGVFNNCYDEKIVAKYGYEFNPSALTTPVGKLFEGGSNFDDDEKTFSCQQLKIDKDFVERVALNAGFKCVNWLPPTVSEQGMQTHGQEFWNDFLTIPVDQYFEMLI